MLIIIIFIIIFTKMNKNFIKKIIFHKNGTWKVKLVSDPAEHDKIIFIECKSGQPLAWNWLEPEFDPIFEMEDNSAFILTE